MKYTQEELENIEQILNKTEEYLQNNIMPKIIASYHKFSSSFNKLFITLVSEKMISDDPYKDEYTLTDLNPPESTEIEKNEERYSLSVRFTYLNKLLNHIKDDNIINIKTLNPDIMSKIDKLTIFLDWDRVFDLQPIEVNTEALHIVLNEYQKSKGQNYISSTIKEELNDINNYAKEFKALFATIRLHIDEKYKFYIREKILPILKIPPVLQGKNFKIAHDLISSKLEELNQPVFMEQIGEVLKEDYSDEGQKVRNEINEKLKNLGKHKTEKKKEKELSSQEIIKKAYYELSLGSTQFESVIDKQIQNSEMYRDENYSILEKLYDFIIYKILGSQRKSFFTIKVNEKNNVIKHEKKIELEKFLESIKNLLKTLENIKSSGGIKSSKETEGEDIKRLHKLLSKTRYIYKILMGLDDYFKINTRMPKGIQIELKVVSSAITKSQNLYFEYSQKKNEEDSTYKPDINPTA